MAATTNKVTAAEKKKLIDALDKIYRGRTSPTRVADGCAEVWVAVMPRADWSEQIWAGKVRNKPTAPKTSAKKS